jgi:hypothetical protein
MRRVGAVVFGSSRAAGRRSFWGTPLRAETEEVAPRSLSSLYYSYSLLLLLALSHTLSLSLTHTHTLSLSLSHSLSPEAAALVEARRFLEGVVRFDATRREAEEASDSPKEGPSIRLPSISLSLPSIPQGGGGGHFRLCGPSGDRVAIVTINNIPKRNVSFHLCRLKLACAYVGLS